MNSFMRSIFRVVLLNCIIVLLEMKVKTSRVNHSEEKLFELIGLIPVNWKNIDPERVVWAEAFH